MEDKINTDVTGNKMCGCGLNLLGSGQGPVTLSGEHGSGPSGFIKCLEFITI
jgi:hypothetical protein